VRDYMPQSETETRATVRLVETIPAPGVGNPESSISKTKFESTDENRDMSRYMHEIIKSGECIVPCAHSDDGCIDGRCVNEIAHPNVDEFNVVSVEHNKDNDRAKLAGGGYITSLAMYQALGETRVSSEKDIIYIAEQFAQMGIYCGAHTGGHGSEEHGKTDCGANDKFYEILDNGIRYKDEVGAITSLLLQYSSDSYDQSVMDSVISTWEDTRKDAEYVVGSGVVRLDAIRTGILHTQEQNPDVQTVAVIKNLSDHHNEVELVVNYGQGTTFSQGKKRQKLMERYPGVARKDLPQVFVLDFWRVQQLARAVAAMPEEITGRERSEDEKPQRYAVALHAGVAFQVATYATLTDGSLPVDIFA